MPELPEAEAARRFAEQHLAGGTIKKATVQLDPIVFPDNADRRIPKKLRNRKITAFRRKGKHMWFELDERPWPTFHFGMTGAFHYYQSEAERPRFWKIELLMEDGGRFAMINKRRLGRIRLLNDPENEPPISDLGFDPLLNMPSPADFIKKVESRKTPIKALLLDQGFAAGVGNWIADDILFQAGINPRRKASELRSEEIRKMRTVMSHIIKKAVAVNADADRFPATWLFHHRWGKPKEAKTGQGASIEFMTVGGRTTAWVPSVQK